MAIYVKAHYRGLTTFNPSDIIVNIVVSSALMLLPDNKKKPCITVRYHLAKREAARRVYNRLSDSERVQLLLNKYMNRV